MRYLFLSLLLFLPSAPPTVAASIPPAPTEFPYKVYKHYNTEKQKYTGETWYYSKTNLGNHTKYMLMYYKNQDGGIYAYAEMYFDRYKNIRRFFVEDFDEEYRVELKKEKSDYLITLNNEDGEKKYVRDAKNYVLLPELELYLVKKMPEIIKKKKITFILFFPNLLSQSVSLSYFTFRAILLPAENSSDVHTLELSPTSAFLRYVLPKDKKKMTFVYDKKINDIKTVIFADYEYRLKIN